MGSNQMGIFCWRNFEINVLVCYNKKFNDTNSHICSVRTEEGCLRERARRSLQGTKYVPGSMVSFRVRLPRGRFPDPLWHSALRSHPALGILPPRELWITPLSVSWEPLMSVRMGGQTLLPQGEETFNEVGWSFIWNRAVSVKAYKCNVQGLQVLSVTAETFESMSELLAVF